MLRAALAVLIVVAILGVSQPAIQHGRQDHAATLLADEVEEFVDASRDLVRTDEAVAGPGARRIVTITVADGQRFSAGGDYVEITGGDTPTVEWAVEGGRSHRQRLSDLRIRTPEGEPLRLQRSGDHRLVLTLTGPAGDPIVRVRRFDPRGGTDA